jgi:putative Mn2+ efflux pump MntP
MTAISSVKTAIIALVGVFIPEKLSSLVLLMTHYLTEILLNVIFGLKLFIVTDHTMIYLLHRLTYRSLKTI